MTGVHFNGLEEVYNKRMLRKAKSIFLDDSHPLRGQYQLLPSGRRLALPMATKKQYKFSFIPASIKALNRTWGIWTNFGEFGPAFMIT